MRSHVIGRLLEADAKGIAAMPATAHRLQVPQDTLLGSFFFTLPPLDVNFMYTGGEFAADKWQLAVVPSLDPGPTLPGILPYSSDFCQ